MAVIPPDAGIRMRLQTEAGLVQALQPVKPIPGDLPELQPGQTFTARIVESLPDSTFKAMVAGRQFTLQLPEGAQTGDMLELVVVDRTPQAIIARRVDAQPASLAAGQPYPYAKISNAGRMIGELVLPEGEMPQPAPLNRGQPLLPQAPAGGAPSASELAPMLAKAVSQSGLFYESHQAQWIAGQRPLESLRAEPQGRLPVAPHREPTAERAASPAQNAGPGAGTAQPAQASATMTEGPRAYATGAERTTDRTLVAPTLQSIPEEVRPLVQQQLDAVVTQRLAWHGEAWPGQAIDWTIEREVADEGRSAAAGEEAPRWATTLRLTMPRLGALDATLQLSGDGLRLRLDATEAAAADLRRQLPELARALAEGGLTLQSAEVRGEAG